MKKRFSTVALAIALLVGFSTFSFGQAPDISGDWLFNLSGNIQGGALITITSSEECQGYEYQGYGIGLEKGGKDGNGLKLSGCLIVDEKGKITGDYTANELEEGFPLLATGNLTGKVDKKVTKLSLKFEDGPNGKPSNCLMTQLYLHPGRQKSMVTRLS
jgi:hypothetical protein